MSGMKTALVLAGLIISSVLAGVHQAPCVGPSCRGLNPQGRCHYDAYTVWPGHLPFGALGADRGRIAL